MTPRRVLFGLIVLTLATGSGLWADGTAEGTAVVAGEATAPVETAAAGPETVPLDPACAPAGALDDQPLAGIALENPEPELLGCSAWYPCVHGGSVSCSSPNGTCISSGQGCGLVVCNGAATFCAGACNGNDWSCARFCHDTYGSTDGYCDLTKCCVCL